MANVALDLDNLNDTEVLTLAETHAAAMVGNANFPAPVPTAVLFDADTLAYKNKLEEIALMEAELATLRTEKDTLRDKVESNLTTRGNHVVDSTEGDQAKVQSSALPLQAAPVPTTSMPQPTNATATRGDAPGEIDLTCDAIKKTKVYLWECREAIPGQPPGAWTTLKPAGTSSSKATGLVPHRIYQFRVRALGPNDTESPPSDITQAEAAGDE